MAIVYSDGFYYLVTYSDKHDGFANYRVDRMEALRISDEPATRNEAIAGFDVRAYGDGSFGMFSGERRNVTPSCIRVGHERGRRQIRRRRAGHAGAVCANRSPARLRASRRKTKLGARDGGDDREPSAVRLARAILGDRVLVESPAEVEAAYHEHLNRILRRLQPT